MPAGSAEKPTVIPTEYIRKIPGANILGQSAQNLLRPRAADENQTSVKSLLEYHTRRWDLPPASGTPSTGIVEGNTGGRCYGSAMMNDGAAVTCK